MPDRVELVGEEELMPGKKWLVYKNLRTGQLSKVPREIMDNPNTGPAMLSHMEGYGMPGRQDTLSYAMAEHDKARNEGRLGQPTRFVSIAGPGSPVETAPTSPLEVIDALRRRISGERKGKAKPVQPQSAGWEYMPPEHEKIIY